MEQSKKIGFSLRVTHILSKSDVLKRDLKNKEYTLDFMLN